MGTFITSNEISIESQRLVDTLATGTLIIRSSDNHIAMLGFEMGVLISLFCRGFQGAKALPRFTKITSGTCRFDPLLRGIPQKNIPTATELIALLKQNSGTTRTPQKSISRENISEEAMMEIGNLLSEYLGPIAQVLCKRLTDAAGGQYGLASAKKAIEALSDEIDDLEDRKKFIDNALICLKRSN